MLACFSFFFFFLRDGGAGGKWWGFPKHWAKLKSTGSLALWHPGPPRTVIQSLLQASACGVMVRTWISLLFSSVWLAEVGAAVLPCPTNASGVAREGPWWWAVPRLGPLLPHVTEVSSSTLLCAQLVEWTLPKELCPSVKVLSEFILIMLSLYGLIPLSRKNRDF